MPGQLAFNAVAETIMIRALTFMSRESLMNIKLGDDLTKIFDACGIEDRKSMSLYLFENMLQNGFFRKMTIH